MHRRWRGAGIEDDEREVGSQDARVAPVQNKAVCNQRSVRVIAVGLSDLRNQAVQARASKFFVHAPRCDAVATQPLHRQEAERALGAIARFRHRDMPALTASCHQVHGRTGTVRPFANR